MGNVKAELSTEEKTELINAIGYQIAVLRAKMDAMRDMYSKLDELTLAMKELLYGDGIHDPEIFLNINESLVFDGKLINLAPQYLRIVDNFASKNTVFRNTGVKRFEALTETVTERAARNLK